MSNNNDSDSSRKRRRDVLKGVGAAGLAGLAGCTGIGGGGDTTTTGGGGSDGGGSDGDADGGTTTTSGPEKLTVGIIVPMTGNFSSLGSLYRPAFEAWGQLHNKVSDHPVELRFEDNESSEQRTSRIASQFASDNVDMMVNAYSSPLTRAAGNVAESQQIPLLSTGSVNYEIHAGFEYVYEFEPPFARRGSGALLEGKVDKVACWAVDLGWAKLGQKAFVEEVAPKHGLDVVYTDTHARDQQDFSSFVLKAMNKGAEAAVITNYPEHVVPQTREIASSDWTPTYVSQTTASSGNIYEQLGPEVMEGLAVPILWNKSIDVHPETDEFIETYESLTDVSDAEYHGALAYGSLQVFGEAVRKLGNGVKDGSNLKDWLDKSTAPTILGTSKFDERGVQVGFPWSTAQWHDKSTPIIWPEDKARAEFIYPKEWP